MEVEYWSTATSQWIVASGGVITKNGAGVANSFLTSDCDTTNQATHTTTYAYPYRPGTNMRMTWYFADYDPALAADCQGQNFFADYQDMWTIPADGP